MSDAIEYDEEDEGFDKTLDAAFAQFVKTDDYKEALRFSGDKAAFRELLFSAAVEFYQLGLQQGADNAAGKGAFGS